MVDTGTVLKYAYTIIMSPFTIIFPVIASFYNINKYLLSHFIFIPIQLLLTITIFIPLSLPLIPIKYLLEFNKLDNVSFLQFELFFINVLHFFMVNVFLGLFVGVFTGLNLKVIRLLLTWEKKKIEPKKNPRKYSRVSKLGSSAKDSVKYQKLAARLYERFSEKASRLEASGLESPTPTDPFDIIGISHFPSKSKLSVDKEAVSPNDSFYEDYDCYDYVDGDVNISPPGLKKRTSTDKETVDGKSPHRSLKSKLKATDGMETGRSSGIARTENIGVVSEDHSDDPVSPINQKTAYSESNYKYLNASQPIPSKSGEFSNDFLASLENILDPILPISSLSNISEEDEHDEELKSPANTLKYGTIKSNDDTTKASYNDSILSYETKATLESIKESFE